ncbi:GNAT family N-acetyltransferase [Saccharopolyspora hattusasensis]|uniref:GNAT family N-acetyltransferase n=1 Tax=Saccharopolyspora hattusasensis TaxID=1128679 RepID=UPI003D961E93
MPSGPLWTGSGRSRWSSGGRGSPAARGSWLGPGRRRWGWSLRCRLGPRGSTEHLLEAMWVAPEWRGKGVAEALVDAVLSWSRADGATSVTLRVFDANLAARRFYERVGFRRTGQRESHPGKRAFRECLRIQLPPRGDPRGRVPTIEKEHDFRDADSTGVMVILAVPPRTLRLCLGPVWTRTLARSPRCSTASRAGTT